MSEKYGFETLRILRCLYIMQSLNVLYNFQVISVTCNIYTLSDDLDQRFIIFLLFIDKKIREFKFLYLVSSNTENISNIYVLCHTAIQKLISTGHYIKKAMYQNNGIDIFRIFPLAFDFFKQATN